jgi:hypothetical protein
MSQAFVMLKLRFAKNYFRVASPAVPAPAYGNAARSLGYFYGTAEAVPLRNLAKIMSFSATSEIRLISSTS